MFLVAPIFHHEAKPYSSTQDQLLRQHGCEKLIWREGQAKMLADTQVVKELSVTWSGKCVSFQLRDPLQEEGNLLLQEGGRGQEEH